MCCWKEIPTHYCMLRQTNVICVYLLELPPDIRKPNSRPGWAQHPSAGAKIVQTRDDWAKFRKRVGRPVWRGRTESCVCEGTEVVELQLVCVPVKVWYKTVHQARPDSVQCQRKNNVLDKKMLTRQYFLHASGRDRNLINRTNLRKLVFSCNFFSYLFFFWEKSLKVL